MATRARTMRTADLSARLSKSIEKLAAKQPRLSGLKDQISYFPDPGIIGFILRDKEILSQPVSDVHSLARQVTGPGKGLGYPAAVIIDKGVLVGFFPTERDILIGR